MFKGQCFFAGDVPNSQFPHFIVLISDKDPQNRILFIPLSSIKFSSTANYEYKGKPCKYYDDACVFEEEDIFDQKGKPVLTKPSFARYEWAEEIQINEVWNKKLSGIYKYKTKLSPEQLKRIQDGAKKSKELKPYFKKFFDYF